MDALSATCALQHLTWCFLRSLLDGLGRAAFVIDHCGAVLHRTPRAIDCYGPDTPFWLSTCAEEPPTWVDRLPLAEDRQARLFLIVPKTLDIAPEDARYAPWAARWKLQPRHATIAAYLIQGASDRDIAVATGLSFNTIRTYVRETLASIGATNRSQLALMAHEAANANTFPKEANLECR
jgi:DNA-binding CsgD family transcriptional regulator